MTFRVGQKVVCVDAKNHPGCAWRDDAPVEGDIYTVTAIFIDFQGSPAVKLAELSRSPGAFRKFDGKPFGYKARRFRPVVARKTSIEIFTRLLVPGSKVSEPA